MRLGLLALFVCGCFSKPGQPSLGLVDAVPDGTGSAAVDAYITTDCTTVTFVGPESVLLDGAMALADGDPALTGDKLELFFVRNKGGTDYDIWHATRPDVANTFTVDTAALDFGLPDSDDVDPAPKADGSELVFLHGTRGGDHFPYIAKKSVMASPIPGTWTATGLSGSIGMQVMGSIDLSPDGKTLYFSTPTNELHYATRGANDLFVDQGIIGSGYGFPTVSADGRELFYNGSNGMYRVTRSQPSDMFVGTGLLVSSYLDPDLTADGQVVVFQMGSAIGYMTRTCPQ